MSMEDVIHQLQLIGMSIDPTKSDLIHFSRRRDPHLNRPLVLPTGTIAPSPVVRWLGIFFDQKLSFHEHVNILCNRARTAVTGLRVLSNSVRGLSQKHLRALHKTCILPIITYASPLWFRPDRPITSLTKKLEVIQNISLRLICGAFKTTPVKGLQVIAHQPPIFETLSRFQFNAARRLSRLPTSSPVFQRLPKSWRQGDRGNAPIPPLEVLPHNTSTSRSLTSLEYLSSLNHPLGERMFQFSSLNAPQRPRLSEHPRLKTDIDAIPASDQDRRTSLIKDINLRLEEVTESRAVMQGAGIGIHLYFCDGSQKDGSAGAGIYHIRGASRIWDPHAYLSNYSDAHPNERSEHIRIGGGKKVTSYDAEMLALASASKHIRHKEYPLPPREINIFSDSSSALRNILDPSPHPAQAFSLIFIRNITETLDMFPNLTITLDWCPGHSGVKGNEIADELADQARSNRRTIRHPTSSYLKTKQARLSVRRWKRSLRQQYLSHGERFLLHGKPPATSPSEFFKDTTKELFGRFTQTLTGHGYTGEYYHRMKLPDTSPWCPCSSFPGARIFQTRLHILAHCPLYSQFRPVLDQAILDDNFSVYELGFPDFAPSLLRFMHLSGAFTKLGVPFHLDLILPPEVRDRMRLPHYLPLTPQYQPP